MLNVIEDIFMVIEVHEMTNLMRADAENHLKVKKQKTNNFYKEHFFELDNMNLNITSRHLETLKSSLRDSSEINAARVLYFKKEIELGNYQINDDKIARSMLNLELV